MIRVFVTLGIVLSLLQACGQRRDKIAFDGQFFRSSAKKSGDDIRQISVTVGPVSASLEGAREAGRYEATRYCVSNFGNSNIDWQNGPDDADENLVISNDQLQLNGICEG